jgi:hypothetical protein
MVDVVVERALEGLRADFTAERRAFRLTHHPHVATERTPGQFSVRPSDVDGCGRAIWYRNFHPEAGTDPSPRGEADAGVMVESHWREVRSDRYPWRDYQKIVTVPGVDSVGRIDEYDPVTRDVVDCKSAGRATWDHVEQVGPRWSALGQVLLYGLALEAEGSPPRTVSLVYVNRDNLRSLTFAYRWDAPETRRKADRALDELLGRLTALEVAALTGEPLERDRPGPSSDPICARCPFRSDCWDLPRAKALGRSGESLVALGETPDDPRIAWAIRQVVEANRLATEAKKHVAATKPLITGIAPDVYVGEDGPDDLWEIARGRAGGIDWKSYHEATVAVWEQGGTPEDVRVPYYAHASPSAKRASQDKRQKAARAAETPAACREATQRDEGAA